MASCAPARSPPDEAAVIEFSDRERSRTILELHLGVAPKAEVVVTLVQQLGADRSVRRVADGATFPHRFVLKYEWPALVSVASRARFIQLRHGQARRRFEYIAPVGIVALDAIHPPFNDRVVVRQVQLGVNLQVTLEADRRVPPRVNDKSTPPTTRSGVFAARPMAGFASGLAGPLQIVFVKTRVRAGRKGPGDIRVAIGADSIPNKRSALNLGRLNQRPVDGRAGGNHQAGEGQAEQQRKTTPADSFIHCLVPGLTGSSATKVLADV
jgi:hypothetical protein